MASVDRRSDGTYRARWREFPGDPQRTKHFRRKVDAELSRRRPTRPRSRRRRRPGRRAHPLPATFSSSRGSRAGGMHSSPRCTAGTGPPSDASSVEPATAKVRSMTSFDRCSSTYSRIPVATTPIEAPCCPTSWSTRTVEPHPFERDVGGQDRWTFGTSSGTSSPGSRTASVTPSSSLGSAGTPTARPLRYSTVPRRPSGPGCGAVYAAPAPPSRRLGRRMTVAPVPERSPEMCSRHRRRVDRRRCSGHSPRQC